MTRWRREVNVFSMAESPAAVSGLPRVALIAVAACCWVQPRSVRAWNTLWATIWCTVKALTGGRAEPRAINLTLDENAELVSIPGMCNNADSFCMRSL